jgi:hypothetical protein
MTVPENHALLPKAYEELSLRGWNRIGAPDLPA